MNIFKEVKRQLFPLLLAQAKILKEQPDQETTHLASIPIFLLLGDTPTYSFCLFRKYYALSLIENETLKTLALYGEFTCYSIEYSKKKHIQALIITLLNHIDDAGLMTTFINKKQIEVYDNPDADSSVWRDDYILEYYKKRLIDILLKIQNDFPCYFGYEISTREDLYHFHYKHPEPQESFDLPDCMMLQSLESPQDQLINEMFTVDFTPAQAPINNEVQKVAKALPKKKEVKPIVQSAPLNVVQNDIRTIVKNGITYNQIIVNPELFAHVETLLYKNKIIDYQYNFIGDKGNVKTLAQVMHILFERGYFNLVIKNKHDCKRDISKRKIVLYMGRRYNIVTLHKTFSNIATDRAGLQKLKKKEPWISKIPYCNL